MFPSAHNKTCPGTEGERRVSPSGDNLVPKKALPRQPPTKQYFTKYARKLVMCNKNYTSDFTEHYSIWQEEQTVNEISNMFTWWKSRALVRSSTQDTTS